MNLYRFREWVLARPQKIMGGELVSVEQQPWQLIERFRESLEGWVDQAEGFVTLKDVSLCACNPNDINPFFCGAEITMIAAQHLGRGERSWRSLEKVRLAGLDAFRPVIQAFPSDHGGTTIDRARFRIAGDTVFLALQPGLTEIRPQGVAQPTVRSFVIDYAVGADASVGEWVERLPTLPVWWEPAPDRG